MRNEVEVLNNIPNLTFEEIGEAESIYVAVENKGKVTTKIYLKNRYGNLGRENIE